MSARHASHASCHFLPSDPLATLCLECDFCISSHVIPWVPFLIHVACWLDKPVHSVQSTMSACVLLETARLTKMYTICQHHHLTHSGSFINCYLLRLHLPTYNNNTVDREILVFLVVLSRPLAKRHKSKYFPKLTVQLNHLRMFYLVVKAGTINPLKIWELKGTEQNIIAVIKFWEISSFRPKHVDL